MAVPAALAALVVAAGSLLAVRVLTPRYRVPAVTAATLAALDQTPLPHHFRVHLRHVRRDGTVPGQILSQTPGPGAHRPDGSSIAVTISDGQTLVRLADLTGADEATADARITAAGLVVGRVDRPYRDDVTKGTVISWSPTGPLVPKGSAINLVVSGGPRPVMLPDVSGDTFADAKAILDGLGLQSTEVMVYSDSVPASSVVSTTPGPGPVPPGSGVTVNVSQGPQIVSVPDVTGDTLDQAGQAFAQAGLQVGAIYGPPKDNRVLATSPSAHSRVPHGTAVDLYMGR